VDAKSILKDKMNNIAKVYSAVETVIIICYNIKINLPIIKFNN